MSTSSAPGAIATFVTNTALVASPCSTARETYPCTHSLTSSTRLDGPKIVFELWSLRCEPTGIIFQATSLNGAPSVPLRLDQYHLAGNIDMELKKFLLIGKMASRLNILCTTNNNPHVLTSSSNHHWLNFSSWKKKGFKHRSLNPYPGISFESACVVGMRQNLYFRSKRGSFET